MTTGSTGFAIFQRSRSHSNNAVFLYIAWQILSRYFLLATIAATLFQRIEDDAHKLHEEIGAHHDAGVLLTRTVDDEYMGAYGFPKMAGHDVPCERSSCNGGLCKYQGGWHRKDRGGSGRTAGLHQKREFIRHFFAPRTDAHRLHRAGRVPYLRSYNSVHRAGVVRDHEHPGGD